MIRSSSELGDVLSRANVSAPKNVRQAFDEQREELIWLASFLLAAPELVDVCIVDAFEICLRDGAALGESPKHWAQRAIVRSALEMQQYRIAMLSPIYQRRRGCSHGQHASMSPEALELLTTRSPQALVHIDALCRFALVLCGIENYSATECANILGVSRQAVDAAYCAGLQSLNWLADELLQAWDCDGGESCN